MNGFEIICNKCQSEDIKVEVTSCLDDYDYSTQVGKVIIKCNTCDNVCSLQE